MLQKFIFVIIFGSALILFSSFYSEPIFLSKKFLTFG